MPACFQLYDKKKPGEGPVVLNRIDERMCEHFEQPCDPVKYLNGWFDSIGFRIAIGKTWAQIKEEFEKYVEEEKARGDEDQASWYENLLLILSWLEENYETNSFYSRHKD